MDQKLVEFEAALTAFITAALSLLSASRAAGTVVPQRLRTRIVEESPGSWRTESRRESDWMSLIVRHDDQFRQLPEFPGVLEAARASTTVWRHVETPVEIGNATTHLSPGLAASLAVTEVLRRAGGPEEATAFVGDVVRAFVGFLESDRVTYLIKIPVLGLTLEERLPDIHADYGLERLERVDREAFLDEEERSALVSAPTATWGHAWAELRRSVSVDKWSESDAQSRVAFPAIVEDAEAILMAIRLAKGNDVRLAGVTFRPADWNPLGLFSGRMEPGYWNRRLKGWVHLDAGDATEVKDLAEKHEKALRQGRRAYAESSRRMHLGAERDQPEDALVDYVIALEAILMADGDKPELSYRLALRCAAAIGANPTDRLAVFGRIKSTYDLRSRIVHGNRRPRRREKPFETVLAAAIAESESALRKVLRLYLTSFVDVSERQFVKNVDRAAASGEQLGLVANPREGLQ